MTLTIQPLAGHIGALIENADISTPLQEDDVTAIRSALHQWKVVFFRDQQLDHAAQITFGRQFGELTYAHPHDDEPPDGYPEIYTVDVRRQEQQYGIDAKTRRELYGSNPGWHTDVTPAVNPPAGSILRADVVPPYGGDTQFTNLVAAYEGLSASVRAFVDTLRAEHYYGANSTSTSPAAPKTFERFSRNPLVAHHPVVRVHPETGERALFVNPVFTGRIVDVTPAESRWILDYLFAHLWRPEYTVRFRWEPGSVAFWDNRATAHLGPTDLDHLETERVLHRVTLIGDVPVGPDGRSSELIAGVPFRATPLFQDVSGGGLVSTN
jgi:taurine dioxygenase